MEVGFSPVSSKAQGWNTRLLYLPSSSFHAYLSSGDMPDVPGAVLLEGMRIVRCNDSPINSIVAAGAASCILVSSHSVPLAFSLP